MKQKTRQRLKWKKPPKNGQSAELCQMVLGCQARFSIMKFTGDLDKSCLDRGEVCILISVCSVMNEMKENEDSIDSSFS